MFDIEMPKVYQPSTTKGMFLKGIIHFTDNDKNFEVMQEEFFFNHLEKNGEFLSQDDFDVQLQYELPLINWDDDMQPKEGEVYGVLYHFNLNHSRSWTDCGYEYDSEPEPIDLQFSLFDEEATKRFFSDDMFQFETEELPPIPPPPEPRMIREDR